MINKLNKISKSVLFKESIIYGFTNALYSGIPILILPLLLKVLEPADYGLVEFYRNLSLVLTPILGLSTVQAITRFYFDLESKNFKIFVSNIIYLHVFNSIIGAIIILLLSQFVKPEYFYIILLCIVYFLFNQITEALLSIFRVEKKPKQYLIFRLLNIILDLVFLAVLYFFLSSFDWTYRVYPNVASVFLVGLLSLFFFYRNGYFHKLDKIYLKKAIIYSSPLILHMISGYVMNIGDRFFILYFLSEKDLGNYAVAYQLGMLVNFLYTSFNLAWVPTFFSLMKNEQYHKINQIRSITYVGIILFSIFVIVFVSLALKFTSVFEKYNIDLSLIIIVSLAYVFNSMYKFEANYFFYNKKTKKLSLITLGAAIITVVLNTLFIPKIGLFACALATLISSLFMYILVLIYKNKSNESTSET
ncbi:lipopolysaccharide biosynthesis protein [Chryseobacterium tongliaoense]|uniref:lipopolysaccharide biosynthesis protein n=1 Tax=Chryseobacterium tongliaoense TaxID=3240933 RepID=UPI00351556FD